MPSANIDVSITLDQNVSGEVYALAFNNSVSSNVDIQRVVHKCKGNLAYQYAVVPLSGSGTNYTGVLYQQLADTTVLPALSEITDAQHPNVYVVWSNDTSLNNQTTQQVFAL